MGCSAGPGERYAPIFCLSFSAVASFTNLSLSQIKSKTKELKTKAEEKPSGKRTDLRIVKPQANMPVYGADAEATAAVNNLLFLSSLSPRSKAAHEKKLKEASVMKQAQEKKVQGPISGQVPTPQGMTKSLSPDQSREPFTREISPQAEATSRILSELRAYQYDRLQAQKRALEMAYPMGQLAYGMQPPISPLSVSPSTPVLQGGFHLPYPVSPAANAPYMYPSSPSVGMSSMPPVHLPQRQSPPRESPSQVLMNEQIQLQLQERWRQQQAVLMSAVQQRHVQ
mmetsp:Transcript_10267/g.26910  ORF Transcript_10267/g.26910 Transcript_10267/m.26910 type:complete len:283 (-) Transcript_10267:319-1167(-)